MGIKLEMKNILKITFFLFFATTAFAQNQPSGYSFCGKSGDCTMTWDEFTQCKKTLIPTDKNTSISTFIVTVKKMQKKDFVFMEYASKGNAFSKDALEMIEKLHKDKKLGDKLEISGVELVQTGKAAKKIPGMIITLN